MVGVIVAGGGSGVKVGLGEGVGVGGISYLRRMSKFT